MFLFYNGMDSVLLYNKTNSLFNVKKRLYNKLLHMIEKNFHLRIILQKDYSFSFLVKSVNCIIPKEY